MAFIKICGMTDSRAVEAALAAGADAIGFVFAKSVRQVTPQQAAKLAAPARGRALCVAVTLHPDAELLAQVFGEFGPDVWQSDLEDLRAASIPEGLTVWPVLRTLPGLLTVSLQRPDQPLLFEGPRSGTGTVADWSVARMLATVHRLILAGGLSPTNVAEAIAEVRPFGVDVSSGVEEAPGRKSPALIESFVTTARAAFARVE
ncbi:MAG: phosphoribosylanthranilate isomerase [Proteobacteria bacterium]|nr:phosphoribosylanthranilate isomerase [Pseudomonadota bacterium]MBK7117283.1 phosphoribosylanthranilate isomerase [Pseudomonadota bacterium]